MADAIPATTLRSSDSGNKHDETSEMHRRQEEKEEIYGAPFLDQSPSALTDCTDARVWPLMQP